MRKSAWLFVLYCFFVSGITGANAVSEDLSTQEYLRQQERERLLREQQEPRQDIYLDPQPLPMDAYIPVEESPCFLITQLLLEGTGNEAFSWALAAANRPDDPAVGRCLGAQGIALVMSRVQNAIIGRGYITTRVLVAPQDLTQGILTLTVIPGYVHEIRFTIRTPNQTVLRNALPIRPGDVLNLRDIEQGLENLKRLPSADADIQITPSASTDPTGATGQSDLLIHYQQIRPWRLSLSLDDAGSDATGKYQGSATLAYDNWLLLNDLMYFSFNHDLGGGASGSRGHQGNTFHYSIPFGYWLFSTTHSSSDYHQSVAGLNQTYVYSGENHQTEMKAAKLVWRNTYNKLTLHLRGFHRRARNYIDDTEVEVQRRIVSGWEAGLNHRVHLGSGILDGNLTYRRGTGALGAIRAPEEEFGEGTSHFRIVHADFHLNIPFQLGEQPLRYSLYGRMQREQSRLLPQERFSIGGRHTVRGFDGESSLMGERGLLLRNELSIPLGQSKQEVYLGLDAGRVDGHTTRYLRGRDLAGAALGIRGVLWEVHYEFFAGVPLHKPDNFKTADAAAGFNFRYTF